MIINCWGIRNNTLTITKSFRVWRSADSAEPLALRGSLKYLAAQVQPFLAGRTVVNPQMFVDRRWKNPTIFLVWWFGQILQKQQKTMFDRAAYLSSHQCSEIASLKCFVIHL